MLFLRLLFKDEGLRRYLEYMKGSINSQGREAYRELSNVLEGTHPEKADFVGALTKVCKVIALTVEQNEEVWLSSSKCPWMNQLMLSHSEPSIKSYFYLRAQILKSTFGTDAVLESITALQHECDTHGSRILQRYLEARGIPRIVKELGLRKKTDISMACTSI